MHAIGLNFSIHNPILMYSFLAVYGVMDLLMLAFIHSKLRRAVKELKARRPICAIRSLLCGRSAVSRLESRDRGASRRTWWRFRDSEAG
ncbi:MAG: hypothetical protein DMG12_03020 [Acidobacteria bacterium]|nr:MAG: hypothetical protein DMG12_03020 [Acidobacteriota bacterium]